MVATYNQRCVERLVRFFRSPVPDTSVRYVYGTATLAKVVIMLFLGLGLDGIKLTPGGSVPVSSLTLHSAFLVFVSAHHFDLLPAHWPGSLLVLTWWVGNAAVDEHDFGSWRIHDFGS